ncbi:hypothetical protein ACOZ38_20230 [Sphaerisporangium viridialbum]|uniref:WXG100-like domain-containing protein n=1 Tax=Sphaerisporangium viridialbum TaxID=46189 RepID=UPI003C75C165
MLPPDLETAFGMLGVPWPTEDEDGLRECAAAYRACAEALATTVTPLARHGVQHAQAHNLGAGVEAVTGFWAAYHAPGDGSGHLSDLGGTLEVLADGHEGAAKLVLALKLTLLILAAIMLSLLAWALLAATLSAGIAAVQSRTLMTALRASARRFVTVFYRDFTRFFGESVIRAARHGLDGVLGARSAQRTAVRVYADARYVGRSELTMLARLRSAPEHRLSRLDGGSSEVFLVELPDGTRVVYKPIPKTSYRISVPETGMPFRELDAYRFSERLGWDLVPPTGVWDGPRGLGSVQLYVDGRGGWRRWTEVERQRGAAFDYVIGNLDRGNNFLTDRNEALRFYDHALSSPTSSESAIRSPFVTNYLNRPLDPGVLADLRGLDLEAEARRLRASGLGMVEIGGRIERLRELRELGMITGRSWRGRIISDVGS